MPQHKAERTVSLLTFWSLPATAKLAIVSTNAAEGKDVILRIHKKPPNAAGLMWYRGKGINKNRIITFLIQNSKTHIRGPPDGPVTINYDGSLLLRNVTMKDAGIYTILVRLEGCKKTIGCGQLNVYRPVEVPTLVASNTTVTENKDAIVLTCYTDAISTQWLINGTYLQLMERIKLSRNQRSLPIDPVQREDAGNYQCKVSNPISSAESTPLELNVKYG
ncbi:carcinoembryonic antigen-related cell adhesion molecule 21-like [Pteronotus mesoamericanus]|uniref:carcinoembryonic antigen-related cell adhesion molecule 21-like n=1 Tax=Pteronotus mesoamericanus TaxID=1884717 RepID=UPI0023EB6F7E|nr:carcinoembryonic antigen-related cell adhesion molecule 21-like [Pteronotus parnellii mesoamericanus]